MNATARTARTAAARSFGLATVVGVVALALAGRPGRLAAQSASPARGLAFGNLLPGVPTGVQPSDPSRSARVDISGALGAGVEITFALPTSMVGPGGATMPLSFGAQSGGYASGTSGTISQLFDPRVPFRTTLSLEPILVLGRGTVFLGATVLPGGAQAAGAYGATVLMSVAYTTL